MSAMDNRFDLLAKTNIGRRRLLQSMTLLPVLPVLPVLPALPALPALSLTACGGSDGEQAFDGYGYTARYVDIPQGRMHYVDEGSGTPVVLKDGCGGVRGRRY